MKDFVFDDNPLAFFLMLVDEMQEWGRPIPIQIRDSYFTTELKKVALLDEIILTIDEFQWLMQYRNVSAKKLIKFDFGRACKDKKKAFLRLDKGNQFPETKILLQDYEIETNGDDTMTEGAPLSKMISEAMKETSSDKMDSKSEKTKKKKKFFAISRRSKKKDIPDKKYKKGKKPSEKLISEFRIII